MYAPIQDTVTSADDILRRHREIRGRMYPRAPRPVFGPVKAAPEPTPPQPKQPVAEVVPQVEDFSAYIDSRPNVPPLDLLLALSAPAKVAGLSGEIMVGGRVTVQLIKRIVAEEFGVTVNDLSSVARTKRLIVPRHVAIYLARRITNQSMPEIGRRFGDRDHTTALNAIRRTEERMANDEAFRDRVNGLIAHLENRMADAVLQTPAGLDQTT